jgi:hypothetical protein
MRDKTAIPVVPLVRDTNLGALNARMNKDVGRIMRLAQKNTRRVAGKSNL